MRIAELVVRLATIIDESRWPLSAHQRRMISALKRLPELVAIRHVDRIEEEFPAPDAGDDAALNALLVEVFELARTNLYTTFDGERSLKEYAVVAAMMQEQGFDPPVVDAITDW